MSIHVLRPGLMTTFQDLGRTGLQQYGVIVSGAMDSLALQIANQLVCNDDGEVALEVTLSGPSLRVEQDALIAITGADLSPTIDGQTAPAWRPVWVRAGSQLDFGAPHSGVRAYLAIAGGFDLPMVMNSRSTYLRAKVGGLEGRPLRTGDTVSFRPAAPTASRRIDRLARTANGRPFAASNWSADYSMLGYSNGPVIRVTPGNQQDWFTTESLTAFYRDEFHVTPQSDRMGYRLAGPPLQFQTPRELLSEAVTMGTIQVPGNGQPIILMADRPTTGGYAKMAQVATVDLSALAQVRPGATLKFQAVTLEESQSLYRHQREMIERLRQGIQFADE